MILRNQAHTIACDKLVHLVQFINSKEFSCSNYKQVIRTLCCSNNKIDNNTTQITVHVY